VDECRPLPDGADPRDAMLRYRLLCSLHAVRAITCPTSRLDDQAMPAAYRLPRHRILLDSRNEGSKRGG
jgi:hypothetical protein